MRKTHLAVMAAMAALPVGPAMASAPRHENGMYGVQIVNYKVNKDHTATINVKVRGLKMAGMSKKNVAGQGHWNILVNGKVNNYSANAKKGTTKLLPKGEYTVNVELVNNDGTKLKEPAKSKTIHLMIDA
jgi:hypothetical protein